MVSLDRFDIFRAVVEAGSLTAAAERLGLSRAVVSFNLKRLEQELGVTLLLRSTRHLALTEAGEQFLQHCVQALDAAQAAIVSYNVLGDLFAPLVEPPAGRITPLRRMTLAYSAVSLVAMMAWAARMRG